MIDYLKMFETSANLFPGFEVEIQGVYREIDGRGTGALPHLCGAGIAHGRCSSLVPEFPNA